MPFTLDQLKAAQERLEHGDTAEALKILLGLIEKQETVLREYHEAVTAYMGQHNFCKEIEHAHNKPRQLDQGCGRAKDKL